MLALFIRASIFHKFCPHNLSCAPIVSASFRRRHCYCVVVVVIPVVFVPSRIVFPESTATTSSCTTSIYIVPCASLAARPSLTCSLFRFNVFFSRSVLVSLSHHLCSHSPLLRHLLVSLYGSVPHAASFYLLGHSPDRPLSLRPFPGSTFGTVAATSCVTLSAKNTARKHVRPDEEHRSARADLEDVFTGYVNPPITRISRTSELPGIRARRK